jgi:polyhydroxyalkanoate synthesis regulator protein
MKPDTVLIKKYANRRLYDTSGSSYINLEKISALILNGTDLRIIDTGNLSLVKTCPYQKVRSG